jgi:anti-sigma regulatory factor (Ser/Thr protein kinase)
MTNGRISFDLKNSLSELETLYKNLEHFGESMGLSQETIFKINLALEELVSNIISYGYTDDDEHWIKIAISLENRVLVISLEDDGMPFNPVEAKEPDCGCPVEDRKIGNLGIHLCKQFMDDLVYERRGNKNIVILRKTLEGIEHCCDD